MGIGDFFKGLFAKEKEPERVAFDELPAWLEQKESALEEREREVLGVITSHIPPFLQELNEKVAILEAYDLNEKKVPEQAKAVVRGNLQKYLTHVSNLQVGIAEADTAHLGHLVPALHEALNTFYKKSLGNFDKATLLIGDEIGAVKKSIAGFAQFLKKTLEKNQSVIDTSQKLSSLQEHQETLEEQEKALKKIAAESLSIEKKLQRKEEELSQLDASKASAEILAKQERKKQDEAALRRELLTLKGMIDFKKLANVFHSNAKKMDVIRALKENFSVKKELLPMLKEAKLLDEAIEKKMKKIAELEKAALVVIPDPAAAQKRERAHIQAEQERLTTETKKRAKRAEKLRNENAATKEAIREELAGMGVEMEPLVK